MTINKKWHLAHRLPQNANIEQRIKWHIEHAKNCGCREIPEKLIAEMKKRKINLNTAL